MTRGLEVTFFFFVLSFFLFGELNEKKAAVSGLGVNPLLFRVTSHYKHTNTHTGLSTSSAGLLRSPRPATTLNSRSFFDKFPLK